MLPFSDFQNISDAQCAERISKAKQILGDKIVLLCHHYQRPDIYVHADLTGDSLKLSKLAAETKNAKYIIFCGVHFMAEVADIMSNAEQVAILPDLAAGCSMADMANLAKVTRCWKELNSVLENDAESQITPVTYINSAANLKAFCGDHGGIVCTSSNAPTIAKWAFQQRPKILFFPDQHLGRWTGYKMGIPLDEMLVWNPDLPNGGLTPEQIKKAKILLWAGHCSVHQMFQKAQIDAFKEKYQHENNGENLHVIAHPESNFEVCSNSDFVGSTELIVKTIKEAKNGTAEMPERWLVGTELNLVERLANEVRPQNKIVQFMGACICMCSTMQRIDPQHLLWVLENLVAGNVVNEIKVPEDVAKSAKLALDRMLSVS